MYHILSIKRSFILWFYIIYIYMNYLSRKKKENWNIYDIDTDNNDIKKKIAITS